MSKPNETDLNTKCGLYITLLPHGYEIDWVAHNKYLEMTLNDPTTILQSECRDFGEDVDVSELTSQIVELIRSRR